MIIVRSPLRITFGGGGTDLPSYYREHEGFLVAAAIDKYVYITVHETFQDEIIIKYSEMERTTRVDDIRHPIFREALRMAALPRLNVEITSMADIPAGTGLGSSGSFTTALLKALHIHAGRPIQSGELAELACTIEIDILGEPVGKQDQYIAAHGGITAFRFLRDGSVKVEPLAIREETRQDLGDNLILFFTGFSRSASAVLRDQDERSKKRNVDMIENLHYVKSLGTKSREALEGGDLRAFAELMNEQWQWKKRRSSGMSNGSIDEWYQLAMRNGAIGGKLIGAGGGGFLLFYAENRNQLRQAMTQTGLREVRFRFDLEGTKVVAK